MTARRYVAWRFVHPDVAVQQALPSAGLQVSAQGRIDTVEGEDSVRQAIELLLSTSPGERVMRPDYGCDLRRLVFSPNDDTTAGLAIHYVRRALERWEPRVAIVSLDATRDPVSPERLRILLHYRVRATNRTGVLTHDLDLATGAA